MTLPDFPRPPFKPQPQSFPGKTAKMDPRPDHGEDGATRYVGHAQLKGKKALVTGGDSGIGAAVVIAYAREGADVALTYLPDEQADAEGIAEVARQAGVTIALLPCDISDQAQAEGLIRDTVEALGGLDILVNNAGYQAFYEKFEDVTLEEWDKTFSTNVRATFNLSRLAVPYMPRGGAIINTASINSLKPNNNLFPYAATKGAIANLTVGLAGALAERGIRVNAVLPGPIWTPFIPAGMSAEDQESFGSQTPFGRPGQPVELASTYVLLAADTSSYTSGALVTISGGNAVL
ncbi:SDR family oxidoreductase [Pseudoxanthomonas composti]|uniref:SDR family oxidoreductase n=1 Tax=Pseudoxanthomonas composti TaxID=2137479 RepID=A0A4Q1JSL4_9GAMM|nr:SDR family oxidoreductase [Pseudoxanthomonas composti]RXQ99890.1 SDR family oxidoreductase [Pseudoxanthomonas composti]